MIKELIDKALEEIITLKGPSLVVAFIIMLGYALKMVPRFPNRFIPLVSFLIGPILTPIMVTWPDVGMMPPGIRWPDIASWATVLCMGLLLSCVAWVLHAQVLRRLIDDKVPALNPGREMSSSKEVEIQSSGGQQTKNVTEKSTVKDIDPAPPIPPVAPTPSS